MTGAGPALDIGAKLGSYFQSDYKIGPVTVTGTDDDLLAVSLAEYLEGAWYPARFSPPPGVNEISSLLNPLAKLRNDSITKLRELQSNLKRIIDKAQGEKETDKKTALQAVAGAYSRAVDSYVSA